MTGITLPDQNFAFKLGSPDYYPEPPCIVEDLVNDVEELTPVRPKMSEAEWLAIGQAVQDPQFLAKLIAWSNYNIGNGEEW